MDPPLVCYADCQNRNATAFCRGYDSCVGCGFFRAGPPVLPPSAEMMAALAWAEKAGGCARLASAELAERAPRPDPGLGPGLAAAAAASWAAFFLPFDASASCASLGLGLGLG